MGKYEPEQIAVGDWVRDIAARSARGWKAFYHTKEWTKKREEILQRDRYSCQRCRENGRYSRADTVHHIKYLRNEPELALTDSNLVSLCSACHEDEHADDKKGDIKGYFNAERW